MDGLENVMLAKDGDAFSGYSAWQNQYDAFVRDAKFHLDRIGDGDVDSRVELLRVAPHLSTYACKLTLTSPITPRPHGGNGGRRTAHLPGHRHPNPDLHPNPNPDPEPHPNPDWIARLPSGR